MSNLATALDRDYWRSRRSTLLEQPWENAQVLKLMSRYCPVCNEWTVWEYFEDAGKLWGICWACENLVLRMQKCYIQNMLHNPIHKEEVVFYEAARFQELAQDRVIDVGYRPDGVLDYVVAEPDA